MADIDERHRHALHSRLTDALGTEEADTLMEHLPPVGWADVATKHDLAHTEVVLRQEMATMGAQLRQEMATMGAEIRQEMATMGAEIRQEMVLQGREIRQELGDKIDRLQSTLTGFCIAYGAGLLGVIAAAVLAAVFTAAF
jgi:hypothetical protein